MEGNAVDGKKGWVVTFSLSISLQQKKVNGVGRGRGVLKQAFAHPLLTVSGHISLIERHIHIVER
jgi:hypothetical protein